MLARIGLEDAAMKDKYVVIIPYYSEQEIDRYLKIARCLQELGPQRIDYEFLLASSPQISPSKRLRDSFERIAPTRQFACPTQVFGYPEGSTAMFWDCMDFLATQYGTDNGFGLWLESDMVPVKSHWLDQLVEEWEQADSPLVLGCYVPEVIKHRFIGRKRVWITEHLNGGACYAKSFASEIPKPYRNGVFDVATYPYIKLKQRFTVTQAIAFSTVKNSEQDIANPHKAILHGFLQDKDQFVDRCVKVLFSKDRTDFCEPAPLIRMLRDGLKQLNLRFVKRGSLAMLEALLMEQEKYWRNGSLDHLTVRHSPRNASRNAA
jgi:hypothetical protein